MSSWHRANHKQAVAESATASYKGGNLVKKKLTAAVLSATLLLTSFTPYSIYAEEFQDTKAQNLAMEAMGVEGVQSHNPIVLDLIRQAEEQQYSDGDIITMIVEINDKSMLANHSLSAPDITKIRTEEGLAAQLNYAEKSQAILRNEIERIEVDYEVTQTYDTALNGMAIKLTLADAKKVAALADVASVEINRFYPAPVVHKPGDVKRADASSNEMIHAGDAWSNNYSGKGQIVSIIDSGGDPNHEIFQNVDKDSLRIKDRDAAEKLIRNKGLKGIYFNEKIPYGYNYADGNHIIKENSPNSHGMHVAGIVAANGHKLKGVAPDAQLLVMRVFSANILAGGTSSEIYNKAIDDSIKLGADSINMSLGATSATDSRLEKSTLNALRDAQNAGIVVAIAIGNDGFLGFFGIDRPPATNPDIGLTNSPGTADISLAVASVDNAKIKQKGILVDLPSGTKRILYAGINREFPTEKLAMVNAGYGMESDFKVLDVKGKAVLLRRGAPENIEPLSFEEKVKNAEKHGAKVAIVYNNIEEDNLINMGGLDDVKIPACFISKEDGEFLVANINLQIRFSQEESYEVNPNGYKLSNFSSWGVTQEGNLKPDISAPGGQIYSSLNDNNYGMMSGTSMATPHVAGGIAVAKQYVERTFKSVSGAEKHKLVKNLLMSTATPYFDKTAGAYVSPRGQGAGMMNLSRAIRSTVVIEGTNGISSINLRNIESNEVIVKGLLRNYGNADMTYTYYAELNSDTVENGKAMMKPNLLQKSPKQKITVPKNGSIPFEIQFKLSDSEVKKLEEQMPNGYFLEGYVFFDTDLEYQNISVPFVGFKGDWESLPVIDPSIYEHIEKGTRPYYYAVSNVVNYPYTHLATMVSGKMLPLGELHGSSYEEPKFTKDAIAFSPNGDGKGDMVGFLGTFLRNYKDFEINVATDENPDVSIYRVAQPDDAGRKNFVVPSSPVDPNLNTTKTHWIWRGKNLADEIVPDGKYSFTVSVRPDGKFEGEPQKMKFPVIVDTIHPRIVKSSYDAATGIYFLEKVEEKGSGIHSQIITIGDKSYAADASGKFELPKNTDPKKAIITIRDHAYNIVQLPLNQSLRNGDERTIMVSPVISSGSVPIDKFKWEVQDMNGNKVDPYNLKVGKYVLIITEVDEAYELVGPERIEFEITENDYLKIVEVPFNYKDKIRVFLSINNIPNAPMKVVLINKFTGDEFIAAPHGKSQAIANVPVGEYKIEVRELSGDYIASIDPDEIVVTKSGQGSQFPSINIFKKEMKEVTVKLKRNDYNEKLRVVFRGLDQNNTTYSVDFAKGENQNKLELPRRIKFEIFTVLEGNSHGSRKTTYEATASNNYSITVELVKGMPNTPLPVDKRDLLILINKAKGYEERNFEAKSWSAFEIVLDKAEKLYKNESATQKEVDNMLQELQAAIEQLVLIGGVGDKALLRKKIDEAKEIYSKLGDDYVESTKEFLEFAIQGAELTYRSKNPEHNTEKHINATIAMLDRAIRNLKRKDGKVDKIELEALLKEVEQILENKDQYTLDSIADLQKAYDDAKEVMKDDNATQEQVWDTISALRLYLDQVQAKTDKAELKKEIELAEAIDLSLYELDGKAEFRQALHTAKEVYANKRASQDEINNAAKMLKEKREALKLKGGDNEDEKSVVPVVLKDDNELSPGNNFLMPLAKVIKLSDGKYQYTIEFSKINMSINDENYDAMVTKLYLKMNDELNLVEGVVNGEMMQFNFVVEGKLTEQDVEFVIDLVEEMDGDPFEGKLLFDWSRARKL